MQQRFVTTLLSLLMILLCQAQKQKSVSPIDSSFTDYDALFSEMDALLDSLETPRSFTMVNVGVGRNFLNFESQNGLSVYTKRKIYLSPSIWYFNKSGLGIGVSSGIITNDSSIIPYQFSITGSYDYQENHSFVTGLSFTRFITKDNLPFYTSPLRNEAYGYFSYRDSWVKPSVGLSYGWGTKANFEERDERIKKNKSSKKEITQVTTTESVADFSLITSIRHDFYFLDILPGKNYIRITPQVTFTSGTQQFGFNQVNNVYSVNKKTGTNILTNSDAAVFDNGLSFQPLSLTAFLRTEYSNGSFFIQPQVMFDYYFPATDNNATVALVFNAGFIF
jgi:hypothetical protein